MSRWAKRGLQRRGRPSTLRLCGASRRKDGPGAVNFSKEAEIQILYVKSPDSEMLASAAVIGAAHHSAGSPLRQTQLLGPPHFVGPCSNPEGQQLKTTPCSCFSRWHSKMLAALSATVAAGAEQQGDHKGHTVSGEKRLHFSKSLVCLHVCHLLLPAPPPR